MFIKFDDLDMLEFFENEPISIGEEGEAKYIYSMKDSHQFSMTLTVDTYAKKINISVRYGDNTIFAGEFDNVLEIRKSKNVLLVEMEGQKRLVIKKYSCLGVVIENVWDIRAIWVRLCADFHADPGAEDGVPGEDPSENRRIHGWGSAHWWRCGWCY